MQSNSDTIVARASGQGRAGVAVLRLSGPLVPDIAAALCGELPQPRRAKLCSFQDDNGDALDVGLALYFPAPASFTGENVLELHGHGGEMVTTLLIERCAELGARRALPGEFSQRAFENDKLDLAQAEAIADVIDSGSRQAARAALRSLQGAFSTEVHMLTESLTQLRMYVEAAIDFPEEEIDFLSDKALKTRIQSVDQEFQSLIQRAGQGQVLTDGCQVVIIGAPNAGKSSLLNALAQADTAIVTPLAGTTRDLIREHIVIDGLPVTLTDTAGLRDAPDQIEQEGIRRAQQALGNADQVLSLVDAQDEADQAFVDLQAEVPDGVPILKVLSKIDLLAKRPDCGDAIGTSAETGEGLDELKAQIRNLAGAAEPGQGAFSARRRHIDALERAYNSFKTGCRALESQAAGELMAEDLRLAQTALAEITGDFSSDDLLGKIFGEFCIGK